MECLLRWAQAMNIGIYASGLGDMQSGGGFTFQSSLLHALAQRNNKHTYYLFCDDLSSQAGPVTPKLLARAGTWDPLASLTHVRLHSMKYKGLRFFERLLARYQHGSLLGRAIKQYKIDVMWYMTPSKVPTSIPYFYTVWDLQHRLQSFFPEVSSEGVFEAREKHFAMAIPKAAYVFVGTEIGKQEVIKFYGMPEERVIVIPMPVPSYVEGTVSGFAIERSNPSSRHFMPPSGRTKQKLFLFYPAQFWPHKNHIVILKALKILEQKFGFVFDLVLTGSDKGNKAYIQKTVQEMGLIERVHFLGFVSIEKIIELYQTAFALVFASYFGPDNIPPLEAFALGCPVVAAHVAGSNEQLGNAALLFNPSDAEALALQIKRLHDDKGLRQQLVEWGKERVQTRTPELYIQVVEKVIDAFEPIRRCW